MKIKVPKQTADYPLRSRALTCVKAFIMEDKTPGPESIQNAMMFAIELGLQVGLALQEHERADLVLTDEGTALLEKVVEYVIMGEQA